MASGMENVEELTAKHRAAKAEYEDAKVKITHFSAFHEVR